MIPTVYFVSSMDLQRVTLYRSGFRMGYAQQRARIRFGEQVGNSPNIGKLDNVSDKEKSPGVTGRYTVVAGAGFEPATFGL